MTTQDLSISAISERRFQEERDLIGAEKGHDLFWIGTIMWITGMPYQMACGEYYWKHGVETYCYDYIYGRLKDQRR